MLLTQVEQRARVVMDKLGVPLEAQHLIADAVRRNRAEVAAGQQGGIVWQLSNLVLMADQQGQVFQVGAHPGRLVGHTVLVNAHAPALHGALSLAAQQQRQQLVTETHTQQFVATV